MERFFEVWEKILSKFQEVFAGIFDVFGILGGLTGDKE